jgi:hypothetical protein
MIFAGCTGSGVYLSMAGSRAAECCMKVICVIGGLVDF